MKTNNLKIKREIKKILLEQIEKQYVQANIVEIIAVKQAVMLGWSLSGLESLVKTQSRNNWTDFVRQRLSPLTTGTLQPYIELAKKVDLETNPVLALLGPVRLHSLIRHAKEGKNICDMLNDHFICFDVDVEDKSSVERLKNEVDDLIDRIESHYSDPSAGKQSAKTLAAQTDLAEIAEKLLGT